MSAPIDLAIAALGLLGGAALGAALGGGVSTGLKWDGGRMVGLMAGLGAIGAIAGALLVGPPIKAPDLSGLLAKAGQFGEGARVASVLKRYYPDDYAQTMRVSADTAEGQAILRQVSFKLVQRQMPVASTENTLELARLTRDEWASVQGDPAFCARLIHAPDMATLAEFNARQPDDVKRRAISFAADFLEQTAAHPQPPHPPADLDTKVRTWAMDAAAALPADERAAFGRGGDAGDKAECDVTIALMDMVIRASPDDAAEAFKQFTLKGAQRVRS